MSMSKVVKLESWWKAKKLWLQRKFWWTFHGAKTSQNLPPSLHGSCREVWWKCLKTKTNSPESRAQKSQYAVLQCVKNICIGRVRLPFGWTSTIFLENIFSWFFGKFQTVWDCWATICGKECMRYLWVDGVGVGLVRWWEGTTMEGEGRRRWVIGDRRLLPAHGCLNSLPCRPTFPLHCNATRALVLPADLTTWIPPVLNYHTVSHFRN